MTAGAGAWAAITASISSEVTQGMSPGTCSSASAPRAANVFAANSTAAVWPRFSGSTRHSAP